MKRAYHDTFMANTEGSSETALNEIKPADLRHVLVSLQAMRDGNFSVRLPGTWTGLEGKIADTFNDIAAANEQIAQELKRIGWAVGKEGRTRERARFRSSACAWGEMEISVNTLVEDLLRPTAEIARAIGAVAQGDLTQTVRLDVDGRVLEGEFLRTANIVNTMIQRLGVFTAEVTRVAREVGTEGRLGGQASVPGVAGTWKDLTDSVNAMAGNLTDQVRNIAEVTTAVARGDLSRKITVDVRGEILQLKEAINTMVDQLNAFAGEVTRVAREVGTEGRLGGQASVPGVAGTWKDLTDSVNSMARNLTDQVRNIAEVTTAVARGDLSRKITVDVKGEILELKNTINTMVDQLNAFAAEVTRVAGEVGTGGKLGGQAQVPGVAGTWRDLTENVNVMAANLTEQVRGIVKVVTAVANGDLTRKLTVNAKGEVAALAEIINNMTETLATFADQVTTVAREVGVEGRLGGQAHVPGAAGTWKDLTGNVNLLADNLTNQVRAIAKVATAVTKGDLTRSIEVEASGEVAYLKDNINTMIDNLRLTTDRNKEQDWLKTNLARFSSMLQGQRDLTAVGTMLLSELAPLVNAQQGVIYRRENDGSAEMIPLAAFAADGQDGHPPRIRLGEGLVGQCAVEGRRMLITELPENTVSIRSGLFQAVPRNIIVLPILFENRIKAVMELASLSVFPASHITFLDQLTESVGIVLNSIEATMQTEALLKQSQQLAAELQTQQKELQQSNEQLAQKALQLAEQNVEMEIKNQEIEQARGDLEEKAKELALTSKYKSEFLANMSHELRTPLNSILVLSQHLSDNSDGNLTPKQVEFARTVQSAGTDLLNLISDILDLSKIESGTVSIETEEVFFSKLLESVGRPFRHEAENRGLSFEIYADPLLPLSFLTDSKRLQQVLKNLLSNAFKFTQSGGVRLSTSVAVTGWSNDHPVLARSPFVISFEVVDTGVGIPPEKQQVIFEAFQQADASTSRKYGGTGLGLAISRELASLLGGEIQLRSIPGKGSAFTLYLPQAYGAPSNDTGTTDGGVSSSAPHLLPSSVAASEGSGAQLAGNPESPQLNEPVLPMAEDGWLHPRLLSDPSANFHESDDSLIGKKVLVVDDDVRNIFALSSVLERHGMDVLSAGTGREAIKVLESTPDLAIVLMDIMMPEMDGYETMRAIRQSPPRQSLPIIALTAKAMKRDREKCLEAGASGYLAKPVNTKQLLRALRICLDRQSPE